MRLPLAAAPLLALVTVASCVDGAAAHSVEVEGRLVQVAAGDGPGGWLLETEHGLLPVELPDDTAGTALPACVVIEVPAGTEIPEGDAAGVFEALDAAAQATGNSLVVTGFC